MMIANGIVLTIWGLVFAVGAVELNQRKVENLVSTFFFIVAALFIVVGTAFIGSRILTNSTKLGTEMGLVSLVLWLCLLIAWFVYKILKSQSRIRYILIGMFSTTYMSLGISFWLIMAGLSSYYK